MMPGRSIVPLRISQAPFPRGSSRIARGVGPEKNCGLLTVA